MRPSPRVFPIPLFDPDFYQDGKVNGRNADLKVANWLGFFVDRPAGQRGATAGSRRSRASSTATPARRPNGVFPKVIRLVE